MRMATKIPPSAVSVGKTSESTNHKNSSSKTSPQTIEANIVVNQLDIGHRRALSLDVVQLGNHSISRMADNGTTDTSDIT